MSFRDYLYRKTEESAHNEILSYLVIVLGAIFLVGGLLETVIVTEGARWFLVLPYQLMSTPASVLGLILTALGFVLISAGFILAIYYDRKKTRYLNQIQETNTLEKFREARAKQFSKT